MSNDTNSNDGSYEFNHDNISKTKMRSFRVNNKLSKFLDNTAAADGMSSNGTEYDKLKAVMRAKYLKNEPEAEADSTHVSTTVNQLQETLAKAKSLLESMESNESDYYKSLRERARNFVAKEPKESSVSTSQEISSSETPEEKQESSEVIDLELDDEMIDEVIEEAEKEESEKSDLTPSDNSQEATDIAENTIKYQLKFESESEESEQEENMEVEESNIDQSEQKSIFGQVSSIFGDETNLFNNTAKNDESYEEKMKSLKASISQKLENTAKEKEIATNNEEIAELTKTENELDKKIREQNDLIAGYKEKIAEKENALNSVKAECKSYLDELKSKDSIVTQYTNNFTITKQRIDELVARLTPKVNDAKEVVKKLEHSYECLMSLYDDTKTSTSTAEECQELLLKKTIETWKDLLDELNAFYDGVISKIKQKQFLKKLSGLNEFAAEVGEKIEEKKELVEKHDIEEEVAKERELLSKKVEVDNQSKQNSDLEAPSTNDLAFEPLAVDPKTDMNDDHESASDVSDTVEESQDEGTSFSNGDLSSEEDAISKFYRENDIKEGELLKTVVSQTISAPMEVPETETLTARQSSVRKYNKLTDNFKNKVTSAFSSVRNSISNPFASKRKRDDSSEIITDEEQSKLDESDIEKIEDTIRKRVKKSDGKYRVVKTYVKDINKGDLIKHPALINPEDNDEEIEYVTLVREKLVTNPTDEVIVISSDDE